MLRRVLKDKQADRLLWATLFLLTLLGVAVAIKLSLKAEGQPHWVGGAPPASELEESPLAAHAAPADSSSREPSESLGAPPARSESMAATPLVAPPASATAPPALAVQQLTTPLELRVAAVTPACRSAIQANGPWLDRRTARPWPECLDDHGNPMVVQLCTYVRLATGEWVLSENSRTVPRCQAELPLVREGKIRDTDSR